MLITITGKIGSGKSTIAKLFSEIGCNVISADDLGHKLIQESRIKKKIVDVFGNTILKNGKIDRKRLGEIVFSDNKMLKLLDSIVHPLLIKKIRKSIINKKINVLDAALFYELKLEKISDIVILVKSKKIIIYTRLKNKYSKQIIDNVYKQQKEIKSYDYAIVNDVHLNKGNLMKHIRSILVDILVKRRK
jgi:dephospho-CoA kinase